MTLQEAGGFIEGFLKEKNLELSLEGVLKEEKILYVKDHEAK